MIKMIAKLTSVLASVCFTLTAFGQTSGNLTFSYTPTSHTGYSGTKNVLAIWIQTSTGTFVKTKVRRVGNGTKDHLPTWASNSGGSAANALGAGCNTVSASTGATLSSFTTQNITWDGTDVNGNVVADGTYKVTIQSTWNHGSGATVTRSFTFTKGASADIQTPTADANFTNISLAWNPSAAGIEETAGVEGVTVYPNPSADGIFTVEFDKATSIKVVDVLGNTLSEEKLDATTDTKTVDLSAYSNGVYFIYVYEGNKSGKYKVVLEK
jgi:hypothetical protein